VSAREKPAGEDAKEEMDLLRLLVPFLAFFLVFLAGITLYLRSQRDAFADAIRYAEENNRLKNLAVTYAEVDALIDTFGKGNAGTAQSDAATWMKERYGAAGIQPGQVTLDPWKPIARRDYEENYCRVVIKGIPRQKATHFLWNVERATTKLRTISLKLDRASGSRGTPDADMWDLTVSFGYRVPRGAKDGS
jgi:hypothetical protein